MKHTTLITALLLPLVSGNILADEYDCMPITGTVQQLTPDPGCAILKAQAKHYPNITFVGSLFPDAEACFTSKLTGTFGNRAVSGTISSGLTVNDHGQLTAASAIRLTRGSSELGDIYTTDVIFDADNPATTKELLTVVDGRKTFRDGRGHLGITGNALFSATSISGTVCIVD